MGSKDENGVIISYYEGLSVENQFYVLLVLSEKSILAQCDVDPSTIGGT